MLLLKWQLLAFGNPVPVAPSCCHRDSRAGQAGGGKASVQGVTSSYRTLSNPRRKGPIPISHLDCWRPRRDLNPWYRRESRPRVRN
jgi:hypothetical protein